MAARPPPVRLARRDRGARLHALSARRGRGAPVGQGFLQSGFLPFETPRALDRDELPGIAEQFAQGARNALAAGFDGVEIHGANGYLFTQFLAPKDNPRTDAYGGDLEGRARLLRETIQAVRGAVAPGFAVGVRLSPVDAWSRRGLILGDGVQVGRWAAHDGADFIHLSLSDASGPAPHEWNTGPVARAFRDALPDDVPVFAAGGIWTREDAQRAFDAGVDVAVLGRACIAHPDWPAASEQPGWKPKRPPWTPEDLRSADVGEDLIEYLRGMKGLVEDGAPARG